jgi:hypothetical protein
MQSDNILRIYESIHRSIFSILEAEDASSRYCSTVYYLDPKASVI